MNSFKEGVAALLKNGCEQEENLVVKYAKVVSGEEYTTVNVTVDKKLPRYLRNDDDEYTLTESYTVPVLLSSMVRVMRETEMAMIASHIEKHPNALELLLPGMKISIILQKVAAHATYSDPFSEKNPERENDEDYDRLFYIASSLTQCENSKKIVDKLVDKILGF